MLMTIGWWRRFGIVAHAALATLFLFPAAAQAQSAIAGLVTDDTGAVLPGVTVEASSPSLIEGTRLAVTDSQGRYAIEALRPGQYKVTFTMQGFSVLIRDNIELVSNFTADVNATANDGATPLIAAIGRSPAAALASVTHLASSGANVKAVDETGNTALHRAASSGYDAVVRLLAGNGARLEARNKEGQTPLMLTRARRTAQGVVERKTTADLLLKLGARD